MSTIKPTAVSDTWITFDGLEPNAEYEFDHKTQRLKRIDRPMITLYKTDNEHLKKAFIKELKELGYKEGIIFTRCHFVYTQNNKVAVCDNGSERANEASKTFDLKTQWNEALQHATEQLQPKYKKGEWIYGEYEDQKWVFEFDRKKGNEYHYTKAVLLNNGWKPQTGFFVELTNMRKATDEEIEQATRKTFFDWDVIKKGNSTKIGCQTFDNDFLQELTEAIFNLDGDVTIIELLKELRSIGFESEQDDLPF